MLKSSFVRALPLVVAIGLAAPAPALGAEIVHIVERGQTLGRIARRYRVSVDSVLEANSLRKGQQIHPGLSLVIPAAQPAARDGSSGVTNSGRAMTEKGSQRDRRALLDNRDSNGRERSSVATTRLRVGYVRLLRGTERLEGRLLTRHGRLAPGALPGLSRMLRFFPTGAILPIDSRLATLVGAVSNHFGSRALHVVSGYRPYSPVQYAPHSNHNVGRAIDSFVDGVPNTTLRDYCRTFPNAGVGYYPNSTFVHLDVRTGRAYWIDYSRPGEAPHYDANQSKPDEAARDVEPHAGSSDGVPPSTDPAIGSTVTP